MANAMTLFHILSEVAVKEKHNMFPGVNFLKSIMVTRRVKHLKRSVMWRQKLTEKFILIIHLPKPEFIC